jgi:TonB family protein
MRALSVTRPNTQGPGEFFRNNGFGLGAALVLIALVSLGVRWITTHREPPPGHKVITITGVIVKPPEPVKPPPPPPQPIARQKPMDEPQRNRVEIKATDIPPPQRPPPSNAPAGGRLALAAEATGEGDAFNLAGNPGGRGLLSGGGLGDGTGIGSGDGAGGRYGWYYVKLAAQIEDAYRKSKRIGTANARVEIRVWADKSGRISRVELVRSTGDPELDEAVRSVVGLRLREPPPSDIPMPMLARFTARRAGSG